MPMKDSRHCPSMTVATEQVERNRSDIKIGRN